MRLRTIVGAALLCAACGPKPALPSEADARAAFQAKNAALQAFEGALREGVRTAGMSAPRPTCVSGDDACVAGLRARAEKVAATQTAVLAKLAALSPLCAEVTVSTPGFDEEMAARIATCPPTTRGDRVLPASGATIDEHHVGWGVYDKGDGISQRGLAIHREIVDGAAQIAIDVYVAID